MQVAGKTDWNFGMQINEHCELDKIPPLFNLFTECITVLQSNLYKTTTLGTTQKCSPCSGDHLMEHLYKTTQTKSGHSWQVVSFYSHCEWFYKQ